MVKCIHNGSRAQPPKMQNPSTSLKHHPVLLWEMRNSCTTAPTNTRASEQQSRRKSSMGTVTENRRAYTNN